LHGQRLSRQFQKILDQLRAIQAERREREQHDLKDAAALLELHKQKGTTWQPSDHGFVFLKSEVERFAERKSAQDAQSLLARSVVPGDGTRLNESRNIEHALSDAPEHVKQTGAGAVPSFSGV